MRFDTLLQRLNSLLVPARSGQDPPLQSIGRSRSRRRRREAAAGTRQDAGSIVSAITIDSIIAKITRIGEAGGSPHSKSAAGKSNSDFALTDVFAVRLTIV